MVINSLFTFMRPSALSGPVSLTATSSRKLALILTKHTEHLTPRQGLNIDSCPRHFCAHKAATGD